MNKYFIISERMRIADGIFRRTCNILRDQIKVCLRYKRELTLYDGTVIRFVNFEQWNTLKRGMRDYEPLGDLYFENMLDAYEKGMSKNE